jgi:hypothetical protein
MRSLLHTASLGALYASPLAGDADMRPSLAVEAGAEAASGFAPSTGPKQIPAAKFAALVGRSLRTLRNWDEAGLTHPEIRNSRRYYGAEDLAAVLAPGLGRKGPRVGSRIRYLLENWDSGT